MKKILFVFAAMMMFAGIASADNDRIVPYENLPAKAQEFVKKYFPSAKSAVFRAPRGAGNIKPTFLT